MFSKIRPSKSQWWGFISRIVLEIWWRVYGTSKWDDYRSKKRLIKEISFSSTPILPTPHAETIGLGAQPLAWEILITHIRNCVTSNAASSQKRSKAQASPSLSNTLIQHAAGGLHGDGIATSLSRWHICYEGLEEEERGQRPSRYTHFKGGHGPNGHWKGKKKKGPMKFLR